MTSSLVGSEMCIRDRCRRVKPRAIRGLPPRYFEETPQDVLLCSRGNPGDKLEPPWLVRLATLPENPEYRSPPYARQPERTA
eukprot:12578232-Prorocentrum_lima.AAC.1